MRLTKAKGGWKRCWRSLAFLRKKAIKSWKRTCGKRIQHLSGFLSRLLLDEKVQLSVWMHTWKSLPNRRERVHTESILCSITHQLVGSCTVSVRVRSSKSKFPGLWLFSFPPDSCWLMLSISDITAMFVQHFRRGGRWKMASEEGEGWPTQRWGGNGRTENQQPGSHKY